MTDSKILKKWRTCDFCGRDLPHDHASATWNRHAGWLRGERDAALARSAVLEVTLSKIDAALTTAEGLLKKAWGQSEPPYAEACGLVSQSIRLAQPVGGKT